MNAPVAEGQVLAGKYRVERLLGQGGMGVVVAAMHQQLHQRVAIKFLLPGASDEVVQRFLREARAAVRLKSEHVARVLDVGELESGAPYMVMEHLKGKDLLQRIREGGALPIEDAVTFLLHACSAIAEAHAAGIIHRDLKPANLFLTTGSDGAQMVKVLDFGISKAALEAGGGEGAGEEPQVGLTGTHAMLGSPLYMSPEQMHSARSVDPRADIWSMGAILYQLLTGRVPFETTSLAEIIMMINTQEPPPPRRFRPELPEALEEAILRCLRKPREERFANVGELALAIAPFASDEAQSLIPKILRTLGMPATSLGFPRPAMSSSSPSIPPFSGATPSASASTPPPPAGPFDPTRPSVRPPSPGTTGTMPAAVARTAQSAGSTGSNPPDAPPTAAGWSATDASAGAPARRNATGKIVAAAVALLTLGGVGVFAMSRMRAQDAAPPPAAELVPAAQQPAPQPPPVAPAPSPTPSVEQVANAAPSPEPSATPSTSASAGPTQSPSTASKVVSAPTQRPVAGGPNKTPPSPSTTAAATAAPTSTADDDVLKRFKDQGLR